MNTVPLSTPALFRLLLWVQWRSLCARVRGIRKESPLLLVVLACFIVGYLGGAYWLFRAGLGYLYHFPLVGSLLSQRILFLIFGFFFAMLVFSNLIIAYSTLFKNRETLWFLSLPLSHRNVYQWKFCEALAISSWALLFLSAPMMAAYGQVHDSPAMFYPQVALAFLPFVVIAALAGSAIILGLVRLPARRGTKALLFVIAGTILLSLFFGIKPVNHTDAAQTQEVLSFDKLLAHTRMSLHPALPSAWLARSILAWGDGLSTQGGFYFLLLLSNALMGLLVGFEWLGGLFYSSWTASLSARAESFQRRADATRLRSARRSVLERLLALFLSAPNTALVLKDVRIFWREPAQWIQFMLFFGLLCIYVANLRNVAFDFRNPFWEVLISHLNLTATALTLSTLTTRFVYPQFSLEGRRIWILGLSPVGLQRVLFQKFWMSFTVALSITASLMLVSCVILKMSWWRVGYFVGSIALMCAALNGLAVGLGALFPNFKEDNPSKIVSGFGGTLCLILSFAYLTSFVALAALPDLKRVTNLSALPIPDALAWSLPVLMSAVLVVVPMRLACRKLRTVEL